MVVLSCLLSSFTTCFPPQSAQLCPHINPILWIHFILNRLPLSTHNCPQFSLSSEHTQKQRARLVCVCACVYLFVRIFVCVCKYVAIGSQFTKHSVCVFKTFANKNVLDSNKWPKAFNFLCKLYTSLMTHLLNSLYFFYFISK